MTKSIPRLLFFTFALVVSLATARAGDFIETRDGLPNTFAKLTGGRKTVVAYFGGSITAGAGASKPELCYRSLFTKYLKEHFPKADVAEVNAALGGTGSWLGAFRLKEDVLSKKPDLVLVEFAVNDGGAPEPQVIASMEGIVRQILRGRPDDRGPVRLHDGEGPHAGLLRRQDARPRRVARARGRPLRHPLGEHGQVRRRKDYGRRADVRRVRQGRRPPHRPRLRPVSRRARGLRRTGGSDGIRPEKGGGRAEEVPAPRALSPRPMEHAGLVPYEKAKADEHWKAGEKSPAGRFPSVLASDTPGATLALKFKGSAVGYFDAIGPDTGDLEFSIDGGPWQPKPNFDPWCKSGYRPHARVIAEGLDAEKVHELKLRVAEKQPADSKGRFDRIGYFLVDGEVP